MIKHPPFTDSLLRKLTALVPQFHIEIATSILLRGRTAKGRYETRAWDEGRELRTSFLARGHNPLTQRRILLRTALDGSEETLQSHAVAIRENERTLPWVERSRDNMLGDEIVTVKPFGGASDNPMIVVRRSALTGFVSLNVENGREMSPAEAMLVAKSLAKAARIAAAKDDEPPKFAHAA